MRSAVMVLATLCFALGFGLNAAKSNQLVYLLSSERLLYPELWARDWLVHTRDYHPLYAGLGALMLRLDSSGWSIGLANVASACAGAWCCYRLLRLLLDETQAFAAFLLLLTLATVSGTGAAGGSYVFGDIFQPSTLGSVGLLGASLAFVSGRSLVAGLCLAFAGAFHLNYLLLGLCVFGVAWLLSGKQQRFRRGFALLGPSLPVLAWFLPVLLASRGSPEGHAAVEEARRIYQEVRSPHHYRVAGFALDFVPWLGFQLLGAAALLPAALEGQKRERALLGLLAGFAALIIPAACLSSVVTVRAVVQLFAWRISPHANLLAQAAFAAFVVRTLGEPELATALTGKQRILGGLGAGCLVLAAVLGHARETSLLAASVLILALVVARYRASAGAHALSSSQQGWVFAALCVTFLVGSNARLRHLSRDSDLLGGRDRDVGALCQWLQKSTPVDSLLLIPPDEEAVRFRCRRAVVVDWKATPALPSEVLEWQRRIEDVTGAHPLKGEADLSGYQKLGQRQLEQLRARYGFDVVVLRRGAAFSPAAAPDFSFGRFAAYRLR